MPTERPTIGRIAPLPGVEQPLHAGDVVLEVNGRRSRASRTSTPAPSTWPIRRRCSFVVERDGAKVEIDAPYALPPLIDNVEPLMPASKAGLKAGDLVLEVDGTPIHSFNRCATGWSPRSTRPWR